MSRVQVRTIEPEMMDSASDADLVLNLRDIARINFWTGARRRLLWELRQWFGDGEDFRFLDVGAASGDVAEAIRKGFPRAGTVCLDLQYRNLASAPQPRVQADAFRLPFPDGAFEVVHCSLFLHHFSTKEAEQLIAEMHRVSSRLVLIQDLHRHWLSYYFLPLTQWCFRWQAITVSDGMKSVQAGWKRRELEKMLERLDLLRVSAVQWHFPSFRYFIAIRAKG
jgi:ubiquinone/menaquinone biosynthesis C-methylase UbiE